MGKLAGVRDDGAVLEKEPFSGNEDAMPPRCSGEPWWRTSASGFSVLPSVRTR